MPFVRIQHGQSLETMDYNPEALEIPATHRLKLFIDTVKFIPVLSSSNEFY